MENKQSKRRWKIPVLLVSAICILLASSFIFSIGVEALTYDYDLQTMYFQSPVDRNGEPLSSVDTSLIVQQSVTENNAFAEGTYQSMSFSPGTGFTIPPQSYISDGYFVKNSSSGVWTLNSPYRDISYTPLSGHTIVFCSDSFYVTQDNTKYFYIYNSDGSFVLKHSYAFSYSATFNWCQYYSGYYYLFFFGKNGQYQSNSYRCDVLDSSSGVIVNTYYSIFEDYSSIRFFNGNFYITHPDGIYVWDGVSYPSVSSSISYPGTFSTLGSLCAFTDSSDYYMYLPSGSNLYLYTLEDGSFVEFAILSVASPSANPRNFSSRIFGTFVLYFSGWKYVFEYPDFTYDFSQYVGNSFTPSRWLNFSLRNDSTGAFTGGYHVGIELDFGVSPLMYNQVSLKGFSVGVTTLIASDFMIESETTMTAPRPLNAWIGSEYVTSYDTHYSFIGQRDGKYLYMCSSVCNFSSQARLNAVKIVVNCYLPYQVSSHNYSIPVSMLTFSDEYSGGGGGEFSDTSSGGGGGTSSDSSSGGTSSDDHPSDMPPEWERNSVEFWFKNQTQDFFLGTYDMWDADTLQVYFGGYAVGSMEPVPTRIRFLKNDVVTEEIRFENLVFQGWSYSSSLSSFEYPTFSGRFVTVPLDSSRRIYLTDYLSNPQLFIADYGAGMLALVNFDSTDSYLTVVNSETLETTITVNNSTVESMIIYGKVMEYSFFTLSEYISWQPYEEGGVYIHANDWSLYDDVYAGLYLHTYITETPPPTVDWWVEYSMELEAERSRLAELESKANQLYGDVSYDPLDDAGFVDAVSSYTGVIATDAADGVFSLIQKMWSANPYFTYFVAITVGVCCCMFYLRKL